MAETFNFVATYSDRQKTEQRNSYSVPFEENF